MHTIVCCNTLPRVATCWINFDAVWCSGTAPHVVLCVHLCMYVCICDVCINMPLYKLYIRIWYGCVCVCLCLCLYAFVQSTSVCVRMDASQCECPNVQSVTHHPSLVGERSSHRRFVLWRRPIYTHTHAQTHTRTLSVMFVIVCYRQE